MGIFNPKNDYFLNPEYQKIEVLTFNNQLIALVEKDGRSSVIDLNSKKKLHTDNGILSAYFTIKKELMFVSNSKNKSVLLNSKFKPVYTSIDKVEPIEFYYNKNIILGYKTSKSQYTKIYSLNGIMKIIDGEVYKPIFDCARNQYLLNVKKDGKYGLVSFNGETIIKSISETPIKSTSTLKNVLTINGIETYQ